MTNISDVASPDAPTHTNERGAHQSLIEVRFDLVDGPAMFQMAHVLHQGAKKYGENNWRQIDIPDHINHLIMHAYAYLAGDKTDHHLSHMMCRSMFAQAVAIQQGEYDLTIEEGITPPPPGKGWVFDGTGWKNL